MRQTLFLGICLFALNSHALKQGADSEGQELQIHSDPLICVLELEHQQAIASGGRTGAIGWNVFYPFWVFNDSQLLERLLSHFDPLDASWTRSQLLPGDWTLAWEKAFKEHYGKLADRWTETRNGHTSYGRRRFVQRLLVEIAYRRSRSEGNIENPPWFTDRASDAKVNELEAQLEKWFGKNGRKDFQKMYDIVHRRREGKRVPSVAVAPIKAQLKLLSDAGFAIGEDQIGVIQAGLKHWEPRRRADNRSRRNAEDITQLVMALEEFGDENVPLAALFVAESDSQSDRQIGFSWETAEQMCSRHGGSLQTLVNAINAERRRLDLAPIVLQEGAKNMAQEIAVQAAVAFVLETSGRNFSGFHAEPFDKTSPFRVGFGNAVIQRSGLSLMELNKLVFLRLRYYSR